MNVVKTFSTTPAIAEIAERRAKECNLDLSKYITSLIVRDDSKEKIKDIMKDYDIPIQELSDPAPATAHVPIPAEIQKQYEKFIETSNAKAEIKPEDACRKKSHEWKILSEDSSGKVLDAKCQRCGKSWMY